MSVVVPMIVSFGLGAARTPWWTAAVVPAWWVVSFAPAIAGATSENDALQLAAFALAYAASSVVLWTIGRGLRRVGERRRVDV